MNESFDERPLVPEEVELNDLMARFGAEYNAPPDNPQLGEIRARVHAKRTSRRAARTRLVWGTAIAAGFAGIVITLGRGELAVSSLPVERADSIAPTTLLVEPLQVRARPANEELDRAIKQAESAAQANPDDPYFAEHLDVMRENARRFRELQNRIAQGAT